MTEAYEIIEHDYDVVIVGAAGLRGFLARGAGAIVNIAARQR